MRSYTMKRLSAALPVWDGAEFAPEAEPFCAGEWANIDQYAWGGDYRPEARAWLAWDEAGFYALLAAREATIQAEVKAFDGDVWRDSCLEWFVRPYPDDPRYLNIEINAAGAALIGIGPDRAHRERLKVCPEGMDIRVSRHAGAWWAVAYRLPFHAIEALFGRPVPTGRPIRGNFYCCDETLHPHFGSWSPIQAPQPDFHVPEGFGALEWGGW